jgi:hypothetical protein
MSMIWFNIFQFRTHRWLSPVEIRRTIVSGLLWADYYKSDRYACHGAPQSRSDQDGTPLTREAIEEAGARYLSVCAHRPGRDLTESGRAARFVTFVTLDNNSAPIIIVTILSFTFSFLSFTVRLLFVKQRRLALDIAVLALAHVWILLPVLVLWYWLGPRLWGWGSGSLFWSR